MSNYFTTLSKENVEVLCHIFKQQIEKVLEQRKLFWNAIKDKEIAIVQTMLSQDYTNSLITTTDASTNGETALHYAAKTIEYTDIIQLLITNNVNPNALDEVSYTQTIINNEQ